MHNTLLYVLNYIRCRKLKYTARSLECLNYSVDIFKREKGRRRYTYKIYNEEKTN